ncbi:MAG: citrate lyase subunit alpha/citrate CoA-transferase [Chlamydiales bacterium]|jgi:citrate lyase subunit alpha/citrate CoA-transferase
MKTSELAIQMNSAGREVLAMVNGEVQTPFQGVGKYFPKGSKAAPPVKSCAAYPADGNKVLSSLREALENAGLKDGMTISSHHHFRNGDLLMIKVFDVIAEMGVKNIRWFPSAAFPCHAPLIDRIKDGTISWIEGSLNGPLGDLASNGGMNGTAVLRSHGGRWQAVQDGEVHIDIAILACPTADPFGNATGDRGPSACGLLGFGLVDSLYADHVIAVTDNLVPFPCVPWQIQGNNVDSVVVIDKVGDPTQIVSGTTELTSSPDRLHIAEMTALFVRAAGILQEGFSFQAGAGGISLAFTLFLKEMMRKENIKARFIRGGSTKYLVEMLEEGLTDYILDGQTFDLEGVRSMRENSHHQDTSPFTSYNWHGKGNFASMIDVVVLGATEVDVNFNANVVTHSDGRMMHGIGGWQNCLFSKCTILALPSFRDRISIIVDEVTTLVGPGELIDVVVTERGIAINPRRKDLIDAVKGSGLPIRSIHDLKAEIDDFVGGPPSKPKLSNDIIGIVKWVDGTVIDSIYKVL